MNDGRMTEEILNWEAEGRQTQGKVDRKSVRESLHGYGLGEVDIRDRSSWKLKLK